MCDNPGSAIASQVVARVEGSHRIRLQTQVDGKRMERLSIKSINAWLLAQGLIAETKEPTTIQRTIRRPVGKSSEIGIQELEITDAKTGEIKKRMVLTLQAQAYLLDHLDEIAAQPCR